MGKIKYFFLAFLMLGLTTCVITACSDDDDEASIEGYWVYDDDDDQYMEMYSFKNGQGINAECHKNDPKNLPLLKKYIDDNWGKKEGNFVNNTGLYYIDGGTFTYKIKGSQIYITYDFEGDNVDVATYTIKGNKLYLDYDGDKDSFTRYSK